MATFFRAGRIITEWATDASGKSVPVNIDHFKSINDAKRASRARQRNGDVYRVAP